MFSEYLYPAYFSDIEFDPITGRYYPCIYLNDYWNLNTDYFPINATLR
jgi:hypothetical protein